MNLSPFLDFKIFSANWPPGINGTTQYFQYKYPSILRPRSIFLAEQVVLKCRDRYTIKPSGINIQVKFTVIFFYFYFFILFFFGGGQGGDDLQKLLVAHREQFTFKILHSKKFQL